MVRHAHFAGRTHLPARAGTNAGRLPLLLAAAGSFLLTGCVSVPLTHSPNRNLIAQQIDQINDYAPIPALRELETPAQPETRQTSARTLMSRGQSSPSVRPASFERVPPTSSAPSKWWPRNFSENIPDTPDWAGIVRAIGPSTKSVASKTAGLAGRTYSRGRSWISGAAHYAEAKIGRSGASGATGEYMVCARPGQVGAGGLCWPVIGKVSRGFNPDTNHKGIDICAETGTPVLASRGGRVVYSGKKLSGFGNVVILDHGNGLASVYGHNSRNLVADGAYVRQGQQIALVGQTGDASTPHCHFEMRYNTQPIDPRPFLP